jgi:predicted TIM-barrel fold metal-dependent hydrolase
MHIYDHRFPAIAGARLLPPDALVSDYRQLQARLGLERTVVVTPSTYVTDNACLLDALAKFGADARGIAVVNASVSDDELQRLHAAGVRGIRFNQTISDITPIDALEPLADRIQPLGGHVQVLLKSDDIPVLETRLRKLPVPVVFDHLGRLPAPGIRHPAFKSVLRLLDGGRAWVKLSGAYLGSPRVNDSYPDADPLARAFLAAAPERLIWGSNWPHPTATAGQDEMPNDAVLLNLLARWTDDSRLFKRVLVDNPAVLYDFPPSK